MANPRPMLRGPANLNIGLIGAARVAPYAIVEPARNVARTRLVAIAARDVQRASAFAYAHDIPKVHDSYDALMADPDIDLVYIATPPVLHAPIAARAIKAGKHVLIEKPFTMDCKEAAGLLELAQAFRVRAFEAMHAPHHALVQEIRRILGGGVLGKIRSMNAHFSTEIAEQSGEFRWQAKQGGGALMDLGIYPLALCRYLLGDTFTVFDVSAEGACGIDVRTTADLEFGSVAARISCSMQDPSKSWLNIEGEHGTLRVHNPVAPSLGNRLILQSPKLCRDEEIRGPSSWTAQLEAVAATLLDGVPYLLADDDPLASMQAIDQIRGHSNWSRGVNEVSELP